MNNSDFLIKIHKIYFLALRYFLLHLVASGRRLTISLPGEPRFDASQN